MTDPSSVVDLIKKKYGVTSFTTLTDTVAEDVDVIPTGSISLDAAIGVGGYPMGKIVHMAGYEGSGKSTLCLHAVAEAQKLGYHTAYIDAEYSLDVRYAKAIGVDVDKLYLNQPEHAEQALDILSTIVHSKAFGLVVLDSVASLVPKREFDGEMGDAHVGLLARLMSQAGRILVGPIARSNILVIYVNQYRTNITSMGFGSSKTTPGGRAMGHYPSLILDVARTGTNTAQGDSTGNRTKVTIKKNKVASPFKVAEFDIDFGLGISRSGELIEYGLKAGAIKKAGAWYKDENGNTLAQGKESLKQVIENDRELSEFLTRAVTEFIKTSNSVNEDSD